MSVSEVVKLIAREGWNNWKMKPCIYPKKIILVTMNQGCKYHLFVWKNFQGYVIAPAEKKKKEKSEGSTRPGDTGSAIATYFSFSCSAKYLTQSLTPVKTSLALIHTWEIIHYVVLPLELSLKSSCSFQECKMKYWSFKLGKG